MSGLDFARAGFASPAERTPDADPTPRRHRFSAHGLVFESDLPAPWAMPAPADAPADVDVRVGPVRAPAEPERAAGGWLVESPTEAWCDWEGLRLRVSDGARIGVEMGPGVTPETAAVYLGYAASTALLHQRGAMPLHAAGAAGPAGGALLVGDSGAGKSTFAAMMARDGWAMVGDDTIALDLAPGRPIGLHRAMRTARLFADSAGAVDAGAQAPVLAEGAGMGKAVRIVSDAGEALPWPAPLRVVLALEWLHPADAPPELERLPTLAALAVLRRAVGRPELGAQMGRDRAYFRLLGRIAAEIPVYVLRRPRDFDAAAQAVALARRVVDRLAAGEDPLAPAPNP
ncbi:hypothetical protein P2H44_18050 [Albimonas sp. CAU 1670]|uniref:hypothetical protein n=1 Tax=Albimonas sp. CAU 1670 TaxID=3032599 RepID=UPI0023DBC708|nr:hypothetical protein [Albimonas sp. CAU 1670]MDF2234466.1 hypothetical protein [Albimonas sp. CAU 1670]